MKIFDLRDESGRVFAFEVDNRLLGRRGVVKVARRIAGVTIIKRPVLLSRFREKVFCKFLVNGVQFEAWEPHRGNDRYWIGPSDSKWAPEIEPVRLAFLDWGPLSYDPG